MMTTLTTVNWISEADTICIQLEASGIKTFLPDQGMATANPLYGTAIGGVRIQVDENDLARARELLKDLQHQEINNRLACPSCGSDAVVYEKLPMALALLTFLLLWLPLLWLNKRCKCRACGYKWEEKH